MGKNGGRVFLYQVQIIPSKLLRSLSSRSYLTLQKSSACSPILVASKASNVAILQFGLSRLLVNFATTMPTISTIVWDNHVENMHTCTHVRTRVSMFS